MTAALILASCATKRPVLYPNAYFIKVGDEVALQDIDDCMRLASQYHVQRQKSGEIAEDTAKGAVVGGASGAAAGAVVGRTGKGAAAGAAGAGAAVFTRGLLRSREPDPVYRSFVERCLSKKGYEPIGWR